MFQNTYVWDAVTIKGDHRIGIIEASLKYQAEKKIIGKGLYNIKLAIISSDSLKKPLNNKLLIRLIEDLYQIHSSGVSLLNTIGMMMSNQGEPIVKFILYSLKESLEAGYSLTISFKNLSPLFSEFFISMIDMSEKSDDFCQGLQDILKFYQQRQRQYQKLYKQVRYPVIVLSLSMLLVIGMIVFILPMFKNIYSLYGNNLPGETAFLLSMSLFITQNWMWLFIGGILFVLWLKLPNLNQYHPLFFIKKTLGQIWYTNRDQIVFAHSMALLLKSGKTIQQSLAEIKLMMRNSNRRQVDLVIKQLESGEQFSTVFKNIGWFPDTFYRLITVSEKSGLLETGFNQIYHYLEKEFEDKFNKLIFYIEPILMLLLGGMVLFILLAVYLPVFDLGNQIF